MHLKRIELEGFKSFADRTVIQVQRGLTGIVGPNGCGKSNVVDALLWVMGERSAKTLRADSMDDVIFKGAEGRAGAPYAMVEIILGDNDGQVAEPGAEIAVGRRLFRTGESEYLLDGRRAKRKEVKDLLMNTGLGVRSYMVLAQGKIDAVLSANPAERRSVFEEAAGISRYKARKHEAELKLVRVAQDLARVEDVYREIQRAVRKLKYQAGKAQRFMEVRDEYREARILHCWVDRHRMQVQETELQAREKELETSIQEIRERRSNMESRLNQLQEESDTLRQRYDSLRAESAESRQNAATLEERVRGLDSRVGELESRSHRETERLAGLDEEERARADTDGLLQEESSQLDQKTEVIQRALQGAEDEFSHARETHRSTRQEIEELRTGVLEALAERSAQNNQVAEAAQRRSEAQGNLRSFERRKEELQNTKSETSEKLVLANKEFKDASNIAEQAEGKSHELLQSRDALRVRVAEAAESLSAATRIQTEARTRLTALDAVEQDMQGLPDSVRGALENGAEGLRGLTLDGIEIPAPWDRLLENLLGRLQHALWVDHRDATSQLKGAADCFFPAPRTASPVHVSLARPLEELLIGDTEKCRAICSRLGEVYCVSTATEARTLADQHPGALFLSECGEMHGAGYARLGMLGDGAEGLLARTNLRQKSESALAEAQSKAADAQKLETESKEQLEIVNSELEKLDSTLRQTVAERDRAQARFEDLQLREQATQEELDAMEEEFSDATALLETASKMEAEATSLREAAEQKRAKLNQQLSSFEAMSSEQELALEEKRHALQEARLEFERHQQRLQHIQGQLETHGRLHDRDKLEGARVREELNTLASRISETKEEAEKGRVQLRELLSLRSNTEERLAEASTQNERAAGALAAERASVDGGTGRLEDLLGKRQELALGLQRIQMGREEQIRSLIEEFQQPLEDLVRSLGLEDSEVEMNSDDYQALSRKVADLKGSLDRIGSVNMDALSELEEREEREKFLSSERADLTDARTNLEQTIEDLDARCRERFVETFEAVQGQFEGIFRRLFRGGRAELGLEADVDPLIAGIDISVRPPGKELRSIKLLSGGERTLTALALLLAVFRSKPSPFCLLDEVDAALDDANVGRFLDVLDDFVAETQFMVVTHNKLTMARCERLFGVTMRKAGVSLVVAVDLSEVAEAPDGTVSKLGQRPGVAPPPLTDRGVQAPAAPPKEIEAT